MKTKFIVPALFILASVFFYALKPFQTTTRGPHGGSLQKAENYHIEMKTFNSNIYTYLLDEKLRSLANKDLSCSIKFFFRDTVTTDATMKPEGKDGFILESNTIVYQSCKVFFKMPGKSVSALFENENIIVNINK